MHRRETLAEGLDGVEEAADGVHRGRLSSQVGAGRREQVAAAPPAAPPAAGRAEEPPVEQRQASARASTSKSRIVQRWMLGVSCQR